MSVGKARIQLDCAVKTRESLSVLSHLEKRESFVIVGFDITWSQLDCSVKTRESLSVLSHTTKQGSFITMGGGIARIQLDCAVNHLEM